MRDPLAPSAASRARRGSPGHEHGGKTQQDQRERNRAPPVLPEGSKAMGAHAPSPEDAEKQESGASNLANPTHDPKAIPAAITPTVGAALTGVTARRHAQRATAVAAPR